MVDSTIHYRPGFYPNRPKSALQMAEEVAALWGRYQENLRVEGIPSSVNPCIAISRKIGVGAVEIADIISDWLKLRVVDRELLEHLSKTQKDQGLETLDERLPGLGEQIIKMLKGQKEFLKGKYTRSLVNAIYLSARSWPCIFVGRGAHLVLPRERVLAVRLIASEEFRIKRISAMIKASYNESRIALRQLDKEQSDFFNKLFNKKNASPYEFDMVINRDHLESKETIAECIVNAYRGKFSNKEG